MVKSEVQELGSVVGLVASKTATLITTDKTASTRVHFLLRFSFFMLLPAGFEHCAPYPPSPLACQGSGEGASCLPPSRRAVQDAEGRCWALGADGIATRVGERGASYVPRSLWWLTGPLQLGRG